MKSSFTNQKTVPATDQKFRPEDEHLLEEDKSEIASNPHKLAQKHAKHDHGEAEDAAKRSSSS